MEFLQNSLNIMLPEIALIVFIFVQVLLSLVLDAKFYKLSKWISVFGLFISIALCTKVQIEPLYTAFKNALISDSFTMLFKCLILISAFLIVFLTKRTIASNRNNAFQFNALYLTAVLGSMCLVSANDF